MSWILDYVIRAKNEAKPVVGQATKDLEQLEKQTEESQKATQKWTAQQQRAAMAMSAVHEQALKMNAEVGKTGLAKLGDSVKDSWSAVGPAALSAAAGFLAFEGVKAAVLGTAKAIADLAGKAESIQQKSALTGWGIEAVQAMDRLAAGANVSSDAVFSSMVKVQKAAVDGSKSFQSLGMSSAQFLELAPEDQFRAVAEHVMGLSTPAERSAAAVELLGKSGAALLPVLEQVAAGAMDVGVAMSEDQVGALADLDDGLDEVGGAWEDLQQQVLAAIASSPAMVQGLQDIAASLSGVARWARESGEELDKYLQIAEAMAAMTGLPQAARGASLAFGSTATPGGNGRTAWDKWAAGPGSMDTGAIDKAAMAAVASFEKADRKREASTRKVADEHKRAQAAMAREEANRIEAAWAATAKTRDVTAELYAWEVAEAAKAEKRRTDLHDAAARDQADVDEWLAEERERLAELEAEQLEQRYDDVMMLLDATREVGDAIGGVFGGIVSAGAGALQTFMSINKAIEQGASKTQQAAMAVSTLASAYSGASTSTGKSMLGGAASGAAAGAAMGGPLGAAIGGIAGGIAGLFGSKAKQKKERAEVDEARRAFIETAGGIEQLRAKAELAGVSLAKMLNAKTARDYEAAVKDVQRALDLQDQAQQKINAAVERYGLTIEDLGPAWARQELDTRAAGILEAYELLRAKGADMEAVLAKMGPDVSDYVQQSIRAGTAIPESMRPLVEKLIENKQLLDENGNAFGSVEEAGVTFAESMSDSFESMTDALWEMVRVMGGEVPAAIRKAGDAADETARRRYKPANDDEVEVDYHGGGRPRPGDIPEAAHGALVLPFMPRMATGGVVQARPGGTALVAGEGGQAELVAPVRALAREIGAAAAAAAGAGGPAIFHVYIGGEKLDTVLANRARTGHLPLAAGGRRG